MIMLELNLTSPSKKQKLHALIKFLFIKEYAEILILTACMLAMLSVSAWLLLSNSVNDLSNSTLLVNKDFSSYNQEIRTINKGVKSLWNASQNWKPITPQFYDVSQALPARVKLTAISLDRAQGKMQMAGIADTRDALLEFQQKLLGLPWIESAEIPNSDLFKKENVTFDLTATLKGAPKPLIRMKRSGSDS